MTKTIEEEQPANSKPSPIVTVEPCSLIIFGGSGDLTRRKLLPAVYNLVIDGLLPEKYSVVGIGRKPWSDDEFRQVARDGIEKFSRQSLQQDKWEAFAQRLHYVSGAIDDPNMYQSLRTRMEETRVSPYSVCRVRTSIG